MSYPVKYSPGSLPDAIDNLGNRINTTTRTPVSAQPAYNGRNVCVVCAENPPSAGVVHAKLQFERCCGQIMHATHKSANRCPYTQCPSHKAKAAAVQTEHVAVSRGVKADDAKDDRANVKTEPKTTFIGDKDEQIQKYAMRDLTNSLKPIRETASDLLPFLATYEMIVPVAFKQNKNALLDFLNGHNWKDGEKANLQKSFNQVKDFSNLTEWQKVGYNQVKEFLNHLHMSLPPLAYAYVTVEPTVKISTRDNVTTELMGPLTDAKTEVVVKPSSFALPAGLTLDQAKKMFEELLKGYEEGKVGFEHLKIESVDLHKFLVEKKKSNPEIDPILFIASIMLRQPPAFLEKLAKALEHATGNDLSVLRLAHARIVLFKVQLRDRFDNFIKTLDHADFDKLIAQSKKLEAFDSIDYLKQEFLKNDKKIFELSNFFNALPKTSANQAWIAAFQPIVEQAKQKLEAAPKAVSYSYALNYA